MGCVASRIDKVERVQICKERKRLMKQLVVFRAEFADAQLAYLRALKNTGVTLRQFTESETLDPESTSYSFRLPPSPPLELPPSPPPPPPLSPDMKKSSDDQKHTVSHQESTSIHDGYDTCMPPSSFLPCSLRNFWEGLDPSFPEQLEKTEVLEPVVEEENWAETKSEFEEEDLEEVDGVVTKSRSQKQLQQQQQPVKSADDNSSMMSWDTKDTADTTTQLRIKKTLEDIVKDLDDYFLKASAGRKEITVLMDIPKSHISEPLNCKENKRKRSSSAKVFNALSWSWSSKCIQFSGDATEVCNPEEPCKPGGHCITLDKLYSAEMKLYKEVKEEENTKLELERKSALLQKQEEENHDWSKTDKTRLSVEELDANISRLQQSISTTCSLILQVIDLELYPQLLAITSGLKNMWRTMYECHQVQNDISQQLNHLTDYTIADFTTDSHRHATAQLEHEITSWYLSFCKLQQSQQEYVNTLFRWIQRTDCLVSQNQPSSYASAVHKLCEEWQCVFDRSPDKIASEAIKSLLTAINLLKRQQAEEYSQHKKSDKLEKKLQKELLSLAEMEKKLDLSFAAGDAPNLSPKHPVSLKQAKTEALKKLAQSEKAKYLNSVQDTKFMTLNNLKTSLPTVFQALMAFASANAQAFEVVHSKGLEETADCEASESTSSISQMP